ncbi:hypothetical protein P291_09405 [Salmonella enterica subsp. arizonae serovar 18:z4,z23:- str. CVM N18503]|uniref:Uncharacterized protein n=1 Tax=Salmonella arizonae (strain ATCC BAA-731 / CDC346-86 / RSK2980) TaxID=41514 RepID=A9MGL4_SALAR|nr:hypothetical protein SARI_03409 [Salmonella enterica subsp. arizonae serovar 62:z4,z23:-]OLW26265.1 hypothetical protein P291_09405 [Salmonella enterica subsp. arizonae serovar 18:z4,z23:- str. CVM N18503]
MRIVWRFIEHNKKKSIKSGKVQLKKRLRSLDNRLLFFATRFVCVELNVCFFAAPRLS